MREVKLGECATFVNGRAFKPSEWKEDGLPIIRIQNLNDENKSFNFYDGRYEDKHLIENGDILLSWSGTPGTSFGCFRWRGKQALLNQHIFKVQLSTELDGDYFIYSVNANLQKVIDQAHGGVGLKHITKKRLIKVTIPLPPLPEQRRIAAILDAADQLRQQDKALLQRYDQLTQSVFHEMFGESHLVEKAIKLGSMIDNERGISYGIVQRGNEFEKGVPVIRIRDVIEGSFLESGLVKTDPSVSNKYKRTILKGGEFLISIRGTVGKMAIAPEWSKGWNISREVAIIPLEHQVNHLYFLNLMRSEKIQREILDDVKGVAQSGINLKDLRNLKINIPPLPLQQQFADRVEAIEAQKALVQESLAQSEALFGSLMQKAFKGEL